MELFKICLAYFLFITLFLYEYTDAQTTNSNLATNTTRTLEKNLVDRSIGNTQKVGQASHLDTKKRKGEKQLNLLLSLDTKGPSKERNYNSKHKNTQIPLNFVIDTRPRTLPIKIPLVIKTANVKPAQAHYKRLKGNAERKKASKCHSNKGVTKEIVTPKSTINSSYRHKPKSNNFFEDDINIESLPPASKTSKQIKDMKPAYKSESSVNINLEKVTYNETNQRACEIEIKSDYNETIENGTHSIHIVKLPKSIHSKTESKILNEGRIEENLQGNVSSEKLLSPTPISTPITQEVSIVVIANEDNIQRTINKSDNNNKEPVLREHSFVTVDTEIDSPDVITIKDHKYEEFEERSIPTLCSEPINVSEDLNDPWGTDSMNPVYRNPYDTSFVNYQTVYDKYAKHMAANNPSIDNEDNFYSHGDILEPSSKSACLQIVSSPETEVVQDIYGQNPGTPNCIKDIRPENLLGRVWRTWKDTEVEIRNRPYQLRRNLNKMNYGDDNGRTCAPYVGFNGYYSNINNAWPYSYLY